MRRQGLRLLQVTEIEFAKLHAADAQRQADVATRSKDVMPFNLKAGTHVVDVSSGVATEPGCSGGVPLL